MTTYESSTDSSVATHGGESTSYFQEVQYPPYSLQYLHEMLTHLLNVSESNLASALPSLNEPTLYALAAALALDNPPIPVEVTAGLVGGLREELRWRDCHTMGTDPTGPVRRGRLVQMANTLTTLAAGGSSVLQRHKLVGVCPFCGEPEFQLFLRTVGWRCFACDRQGALLEFAECLLETCPPAESIPSSPPPT